MILDEYQDIEQEIAEMLYHIKDANPGIQIIAVGDMAQKIYDKTRLNAAAFITDFLGAGKYRAIEFTQCFRLSPDLAQRLGTIWGHHADIPLHTLAAVKGGEYRTFRIRRCPPFRL